MAESTKSSALFISGPEASNSSMGLFVSAPIESSGNMPLFVKQDTVPSGNISLYIYHDKYAQPSGDGQVAYSTATLYMDSENPTSSGLMTLYVPATGSNPTKNNNISLFTSSPVPSSGEYGYISSGLVPLFINSNNDDSVFFAKNQSLSVYLKNSSASPYDSGILPLYIERVTDTDLSLFIRSSDASGVIPMFVSGQFIDNNSMDLYISPAPENNIKLFTRGFSS